MSKRLWMFFLVPAVLLINSVASAQYPIMDAIADRVIQRYQNSSCEQLA